MTFVFCHGRVQSVPLDIRMQGDLRVLAWIASACQGQLACLPTTLAHDQDLYCSLLNQEALNHQGQGTSAGAATAAGACSSSSSEGAAPASGVTNSSSTSTSTAAEGAVQEPGSVSGGNAGATRDAHTASGSGSSASLGDGMTASQVALEWRLAYKRVLARGLALALAGAECLQRRLQAERQEQQQLGAHSRLW